MANSLLNIVKHLANLNEALRPLTENAYELIINQANPLTHGKSNGLIYARVLKSPDLPNPFGFNKPVKSQTIFTIHEFAIYQSLGFEFEP
eukprot:Awhi_evm1s10759